MEKKHLITSLFGIAGAIFVPRLAALPKVLSGSHTIEITASNLSYTFFGVLVLGLLTGAIRKQERILTTFISLIIFGLPLLILWQQKVIFNLNVLVWGLLVLVGIVLVVVWVRQMIQDDKNQ
ncbi:hypothetical protein [Lactococcus lactis]|uniref:hypothetical protein n=1 Tax=Lactococcus lactis TaxID=1358 RepID=UPI0021A8350F|nr:hypothetical protein [Lactococcus lactis]MCT3126566.1 hypothetical protein [Lactococcus lactis]